MSEPTDNQKPERKGVAAANAAGNMAELFDHRTAESEQKIGAKQKSKDSRRSKLQIVPSCAITDRVAPWIPPSRRNMAAVKPGLRDLLRNLSDAKADWPLYLYGETGRGKTSAALALADFCEFAFYSTLESLSNEVMAGGVDWEMIGWADLAILDEIGARNKATDLAYSTLYTFWERRERRQQRTIYIGNLSPQRLADVFDDRIASRLLFGTVVELQDNDRRKAGQA